MFHPTFEPRKLSDQDLESKINDVTLKINQAKRMNHAEFYKQLLAINNTLQMEKQERQAKKAKEENKTDTDLDGLINVE